MARAAVAATALAAASLALAADPVQVTFPAPPTGHSVQANFLGLSIELSFLNVYFGNDTNTIPPPILSYLGAIRNQTGGQPVRIRLGGNSMDSSTYAPDQKDQMLVFTNPNANFNDQPVDFGPTLWDQLKHVGDGAGGAEYTIGLSLLTPTDKRAPNVPVMAAAAKSALGDRLDTFLLGNEPDLYTGHQKRPQLKNYTVENYVDDFQQASDGLRKSPSGDLLSGDAIIGGPTICCAWDLASVLQQNWLDKFSSELKYISLQHYPQNWCSPPKHAFEIDYYYTHSRVIELARWNDAGVQIAVQAGKKVMMSEFNSASCGGIPGISDTFAAGSLWVLDYALQMATLGYDTAFQHLREPNITYNAFDAPVPAGSQGEWKTYPNFYPLLVAPEILCAAAGSRVVDLNLDNSMWQAGKTAAGYAAYDVKSGAVNTLALFNFAQSGTQSYALPKELFANASSQGLPGFSANNVRVKYLTGKSMSEKYDISWAGMTYQSVTDGKAVPDKSGRPGVATIECSNGCSLDIPAPGLAVVFLGEEPQPSNLASDLSGSNTGSDSSSSGSNSNSGSGSADSDAKAKGKNSAASLGMSAAAALSALLGTLFVIA